MMKHNAFLARIAPIACAAVAVAAGCGGSNGATGAGLSPTANVARRPATSVPVARTLYADHNGTLDAYALPLHAGAKPVLSLQEDPGAVIPPHMAVSSSGEIAVGTATEIRFFKPPIVTLKPKAAFLRLQLNGAITAIGTSGAQIVDMEYDPSNNLWLLSNLAGEITELQRPIGKTSVASTTVLFGVKGTKTSAFPTLLQARFDVSSALYPYATGSTSSRLFKSGFPYVSVSSLQIDLQQADFVDPSQYLPTNPNPVPLLLGQYNGSLSSPPPQQPPPPPVNVLAQFAMPLNPVTGFFPDATVKTSVGALIADPPRTQFYTIDIGTGRINAWALPLHNNATPLLSAPCAATSANCVGKPEHLWLAP